MFLKPDIVVGDQQSWILKLSPLITFRRINPVINTLRLETDTLDELDENNVQGHRQDTHSS